jgi:hypothetical protein
MLVAPGCVEGSHPAPVACRVAKIARTLTWERALRASREQGEPIDPAWSAAAFETLASVLRPSYAGAA